jgi:hypothetical protein
MRTALVLVLLAVLGARAAADCDPKAAPIFTRDTTPLKAGGPGHTQALVIRASGAWTRTGDDAGKGCLSAARKALVEAALANATFKTNPKARRCRVVPFSHVVYAAPARKLTIAHDEPCGEPFDEATSTAIACADAAVDDKASDDEVKRSCTAP